MRARVALQAGRIDLFGRSLGGIEDLGHVAAALNVGFARPVTALARYSGASVFQGQFAVRIVGESLRFRCVACGADLFAHKVLRRGILCRSGGCFGFCAGYGRGFGRRSGRSDGAQYARAQHQHQTSPVPEPLAWSLTRQKSRYRPISMYKDIDLCDLIASS